MIIKVLESSPTLYTAPNGPKHDTRSIGPKDSVAAPWQILDADLFRRFPLGPVEFGHETKTIGWLMKLDFHAYVGHRKWSLDASWASILQQASP